ncbi:MAG TPA: O-antigen ligase family protein [Verrucomicrobiae bacterium]|nr:O-antigen ligase family protein [Verrucomicrobiae bacterium]
MKNRPTIASRPASVEEGGRLKPDGVTLYALVFGCFLGLCIWKFGNPVILDAKIDPPTSLADVWTFAWPIHWANWLLLPLAVIGAVLAWQKKLQWPGLKWLWLLPLLWLGWQFVSATRSVDFNLTAATLWQFFGVVACYFLSALLFANRTARGWLLVGVMTAFTFCLIRGVNQKVFEFPVNYQVLVEGESNGWTNFPPETITSMKHENIIITTNGMDVANPVIVKKFKMGRIAGTMVYPNALAGLILLLWPVSLALVIGAAKKLKPMIRVAAVGMVVFLGGAAFFWTGSKLGWLVGIGIAGLFLLRLDWSKKLKLAAVAAILILGLGVFAVRFHAYFAAGATSVGARFDYWRAAGQTTIANPVFGSGPGTFQRPYAQLKSPDAEMARLTHNDYLEQFSDSGLIGGVAFAVWVILALAVVGRKIWSQGGDVDFALFAGLLAWFAQSFGEFGLYIPALAWLAFTLLGGLIGLKIIEIDKKSQEG